jgi:pimeloyl-ACP methyl ester carboxylesterase
LPDRRYVLHSLAAIPALLATRRGHAADIEPHVSGEPNMSRYEDVWYQSSDGLKLYARDYPNASARATVLCMHGLTRNSADFAELADALQANYRVIAVDQRGRGRSAWDPNPANYNPLVYVRDMYTLLDGLGLQQVIAIGTSMGGIMSMIMSALQPARFRAVLLNDIGPVIAPAGLDRIRGYVGKVPPVTSWAEAETRVRQLNTHAFPHWQAEDWSRFARKLYQENADGVPQLAHDPAIAESLKADPSAPPPDLWPSFQGLAQIPTLVLRGSTSDILDPECVAEMQRRKPDIKVVEVPGVGHAPMLDEPVARQAVLEFLAANA